MRFVRFVIGSFLHPSPQYLIFFPVTQGGMPGASTLKDCKTLESMVKKQAADGRLYAAICAAPAVALGSWGLLKGKKVCIQTVLNEHSS